MKSEVFSSQECWEGLVLENMLYNKICYNYLLKKCSSSKKLKSFDKIELSFLI